MIKYAPLFQRLGSFFKPAFLITVLFVFLYPGVGFTVSPEAPADRSPQRERRALFPYIYFTETIDAIRNAPFWVHTEEEQAALERAVTDYQSLLLNNDILAYYGHPLSRNMGILGRFPIEELYAMMSKTAEKYRAAGGRNVIKAFHIIYGTAWPEGQIGRLNHNVLRRWIEFALEHDMLVFLDHQIGRYDPVDSVRMMFPWLHYPNVHLAIDPEWRTLRPNIEIGHVTADEINRAQQIMEEYIYENDLPGERFLMVHQFHWIMIRNRDDVDATFRRVRLVHNIAGIGMPEQKRRTYEVHGARAPNIPVKGFKLWYYFGFPGNHHDDPLMTPEEVMALYPRPFIIMYQ